VRPFTSASAARVCPKRGKFNCGSKRPWVVDPRELLAYTLLHVHSNLPECLGELRAPPEPTLDSLALTWFGTAQTRHRSI